MSSKFIKRRMTPKELKAHRKKMEAIGVNEGTPLYYEDAKQILPDVEGKPKCGVKYNFGQPKELEF